jgi:hypothetical protein
MNGSVATDGTSSTKASAPLRLYSLGGGEPPPDLGSDLERVARMPPDALQKFWQVLAPSLADVITKETEELLDLFCAAYKVNEEELGRTIRACRFVIREGAQRDVPAEAVAEDLERLCPGQPLVRDILLAGYDAAKVQLRRDIIGAALADHGKLLVGVKWRLDAVQASERGVKMQVPVVMLTLHYREGAEAGRITLQALPDMMQELRTACEKLG